MSGVRIYNAGSRVMNTYVYPAPAGWVMVDTGYDGGLAAVKRRLKRKGVALSELRYVFLTHAHDDHAGFLNELLSSCPWIKVIASGKAIPTLLRGQNSFEGGCGGFGAFAFCKFMGLLGRGKHLFPAIDRRHLDRFLEISPQNQEDLEKLLGGKILTTPGHTADSISLKVDDIVFCGDAAMNGVPSSKRVTIWIEDKAEFQRSWDVLLAERAKLIYPAHGKPFDPHDLEKYRGRIPKIRLYPLK